jgi:hypothetical protein
MYLILENLLWIISILSSLKFFQCGQCPPSNKGCKFILNLRKCRNDIIGGNVTMHFKAIFHRMSYELEDGKKHFQKFYLNNTAISELLENTFECSPKITCSQWRVFQFAEQTENRQK